MSLWDTDFISFGYIPRGGTAASYSSSIFNFWGTSILFSIMIVQICIPANSAQGFSFVHFIADLSCLSDNSIPTGVMWFLNIILIWIFLIISYIEHLFMYLLPVCNTSFEKCILRSFAHFFNWVKIYEFWILTLWFIWTYVWSFRLPKYIFHIYLIFFHCSYLRALRVFGIS